MDQIAPRNTDHFRGISMHVRTIPPRAFTLIELLVVVAVIAILAAIAIPNMLLAQTRAKVSRVKNDLRATATSIEAYSTDNGRPPYDGEPGFAYYGWVNALKQLTTPIAYQTQVFVDVFTDPGIVQEPTRPGHTHFVDFPSRDRVSFDYSTAYWNDLPNDPAMAATWRANFGESAWKITSAGPDRMPRFGLEEHYDPTNGTSSWGDIVRTQAVY